MEEEKDSQEPTVASLDDYKKENQKSKLARLEDHAIKMLYALIERPADSKWFWIVTTVGMFAALVGPAVLIGLYFLGRDLGYFE